MSTVISAPVHMVEAVASLRLPVVSDRRLQSLMNRHTEGQLDADEQDELQSLVELSETMALLRADALELLGRMPQ